MTDDEAGGGPADGADIVAKEPPHEQDDPR